MRRLSLIAAGVLTVAGGAAAFAQMPPPGGPGGPPGMGERGQMRPSYGGGGEEHWGEHHGGPGGPGGPGRMMMMHMMEMASRGAHFHLKRGDAELDIKCSSEEPMRACVDAAGTLLDKVGQQRQGATTGTPTQ